MDEKKTTNGRGFSSPLMMAISLIAASVGTGNIWRFPRVMATNGGSAFVVAYVVIMLIAVIPVMMGEHVIGRCTRKGLPGAFRDFLGSRKATWLGTFVEWVVIITIAYYTVVVAWIFQYLGKSITGSCFVEDKAGLFASVSDHNWVSVLIYIAIQVFCCWGAYKGIKAIEQSTKILLPILFACIIILAVRTVTLPGATAGLNFMFNLKFSDLLNYKIWLEALTQCLWSAGPGWGICIAYGVYAKKKDDVVLATTVQGFGDMSVAMLASVAILPGLFSVLGEQGALDACASGNNGLAFIALTGVFETMAGGRIFACLFWIALICASITSIIAMYSIVVQPLADAGISKKKACIIMGVITIALGIPSAWSNFVFCNQDFVVGQAMVIGATFSGYALLKFGPEKVRSKFLNHPNTSLHIGKRFNWGAAILLPVLAVVMFVWWCIQYIGWEPNWWKPFEMYSLGSMLWQLGIPMILFAVFNKKIAASAGPKYFNGEEFPDIVDNGFNS